MDADPSFALPPAPLLLPRAPLSRLRPTRSLKPHPESYILTLTPLPSSSQYVLSFSHPTSSLSVLSSTTLSPIRTLDGHTGAITDVEAMRGEAEGGVLSGSRDGVVRRWDPRVGEGKGCVGVFKGGAGGRVPGVLSVAGSGDGRTIAAGTELVGEDASVYIWDTRSPSHPLATHTSTHSDDITTLSFHPSHSSTLLSGSADGLLALSNISEPDEDEAVLQTTNWGASVAACGWAPDGGRVWARSDMETVGVWDGELESVRELGDVRRVGREGVWGTDYVVQCGFKGEEVVLVAGSNEGGMAEISTGNAQRWVLERVFEGGHTGIVRCAYFDEKNNKVLTGGEDSKLTVWSVPPPPAASEDAMDVDSPQSTPSRAPRIRPRGGGGSDEEGGGQEDVQETRVRKKRRRAG